MYLKYCGNCIHYCNEKHMEECVYGDYISYDEAECDVDSKMTTPDNCACEMFKELEKNI